MEYPSLAALLDGEKDMALANMAGDRSLAAAQSAMEKAIDRVMYRYVEQCPDGIARDCAQVILQTVKNTLPLIDSVGETRAWKKQADAPKPGMNLGIWALVLLIGGAVLLVASVLGMLIGGRFSGVFEFIKGLLPTALGGVCLFLAGLQAGRPGKAKPGEEAVRTEFLADAEKAWHTLRGAMLQADGQLERLREEEAMRAAKAGGSEAAGGELSPAALELFGELLESAYAAGDEASREAASSIGFYLHNAGVDVVDCAAGKESWFEFLPAPRPGTIRPALVSEGRLLKKGLASAG